MNEGLAKAAVLCLGRMSWRESTVAGEVEKLADMPAKVGNRLRFFQLTGAADPSIPDKSDPATFDTLFFRKDAIGRHCIVYRSISTPVQTEEAFHNLTSEIRTKMLLECIFYYGVGFALQLCEEPVDYDPMTAHSWIRTRFERNLRLNNMGWATDPGTDPYIHEKSFWAAGIGYPFRSEEA